MKVAAPAVRVHPEIDHYKGNDLKQARKIFLGFKIVGTYINPAFYLLFVIVYIFVVLSMVYV